LLFARGIHDYNIYIYMYIGCCMFYEQKVRRFLYTRRTYETMLHAHIVYVYYKYIYIGCAQRDVFLFTFISPPPVFFLEFFNIFKGRIFVTPINDIYISSPVSIGCILKIIYYIMCVFSTYKKISVIAWPPRC